mmetsp:Transcript_25711/g.59294  ORF Transcript_25711/g.59294 Transcript_25711/m.59294 type:complete len:140 (-) Transcript_25711:96-515(-)|eukprot:CAMPEP_0114539832 /NCGR_PEP_ID=MMETSP0114-20121206/448_1 /TAXON_ID=31324 /ORGANISM="Goniomonas sp, Strain m" /LENGTH=139 /DNA_ID=CAMNT_0001723961 /DNA_START=11 /DNA_END=430 /DNA_ORIENTATION=-
MAAGGDNFSKFFTACETGKGWDACKEFCTDDAAFEAQCEPLVDVKTLQAYTDWMKGLATSTMPGCSYDIHHASVDPSTNTACYFATFKGTHSGPGPCDPTGKSTVSHYCYFMHQNESGKIDKMIKIWNAPWAMKELGWM